MIRSIFLAVFITLGFAMLPAFPVKAQADGMTEAEIAEAFAKQKTRGLTIAPTSPVGTAPTDPTATATQVFYAEIPEEEQVNIAIGFDFDSAALREDQKPKLVALCNVMKAADIPVFRIVGHTDSSGSAQYNEKLSLLRAEEVKRHLATDCGIADDRMQAVGVGAQFPFDAANPRGDVNRRVEFQALS
ncbi:OmpA family protein [Paracoccaceae bacterium Fryx2]|nr:OmpA family protein [Paracoccaceae bacterium Fryx2]